MWPGWGWLLLPGEDGRRAAEPPEKCGQPGSPQKCLLLTAPPKRADKGQLGEPGVVPLHHPLVSPQRARLSLPPGR